jgi:integrase
MAKPRTKHPRVNLTEGRVRRFKPPRSGYDLHYDRTVRRLALAVYASGTRTWKFLYTVRGKTQWVTIGSATHVTVAAARDQGHRLAAAIADGRNPQSEHMEARKADTFWGLADRYFDEYAEQNLKSHYQTRYLLTKYLPDRFCETRARELSRADVKAILLPLASKTPGIARQVLAAISSVCQWAVDEAEVLSVNPCREITRTKPVARERVLSIEELPRFWAGFGNSGVAGVALKVLLLTGQRPGEIAAMNRAHVRDGWWEMPGQPDGERWPGTKNANSHRIWLPAVAVELVSEVEGGPTFVFGRRPHSMAKAMRSAMASICKQLKVERATPHDLRRTHGTTVCRLLGFGGSDAMNRIQNHVEGGITTTYNRYGYELEIKTVMERVAEELMRVVALPLG